MPNSFKLDRTTFRTMQDDDDDDLIACGLLARALSSYTSPSFLIRRVVAGRRQMTRIAHFPDDVSCATQSSVTSHSTHMTRDDASPKMNGVMWEKAARPAITY